MGVADRTPIHVRALVDNNGFCEPKPVYMHMNIYIYIYVN